MGNGTKHTFLSPWGYNNAIEEEYITNSRDIKRNQRLTKYNIQNKEIQIFYNITFNIFL
jgi:hypothetical protein